MRSSKSRSRSKNNRNRSMGNVVNRVFDSSGPEGKVRGTPQQIIDKYNQLARDAQLANDRVATENFQQHAEHYLRMLAEALKEQAERQSQQQQNQNPNQNRNHNNNQQNGQRGGGDANPQQGDARQPAPEQANDAPAPAPAADVIDMDASSDSALVETPEDKAPKAEDKAPKPRRRKPQPKVEKPQADAEAPTEQPTPPADAAE